MLDNAEAVYNNFAFALGGAVTDIIERGLCTLAKPFFQAWALFRQTGEDETPVGALALRALHLELWISQIDNAFIALFHWDVAQATVHVELPCMIGTAKSMFISRITSMIITN